LTLITTRTSPEWRRIQKLSIVVDLQKENLPDCRPSILYPSNSRRVRVLAEIFTAHRGAALFAYGTHRCHWSKIRQWLRRVLEYENIWPLPDKVTHKTKNLNPNFALVTFPLGQLNHPTPGMPCTADRKPNLTAPTPLTLH